VDLHNGFSAGHGIVVHVGVEEGEAPGNESFHFAGVELIAHADFERPGNDRHVFPVRMPMGRDAEPIGHFQANREVTGGGGRVAFSLFAIICYCFLGGSGLADRITETALLWEDHQNLDRLRQN